MRSREGSHAIARRSLSVLATLRRCRRLASAAPAAADPPPSPPSHRRPVCAGCHEDKRDVDRSHARTARRTTRSGSMCQACHGDATEHLKDPTKAKPANPFSSLTPATATEQTAVCLDLPHRQSPPRLLGIGQARQERRDVRQLPQHPRQAERTRRSRRSRRASGPTRRTSAARATSRSARRS